jgi:outer membrane receptor protein involved in Fe transport
VRGGARHTSLVSVAVRDVEADLFQGPPSGPLGLTAAGQRTAAATLQTSLQPADAVTLGLGVRGEVWHSELRNDADARMLSRWLPRASIAWRVSPGVSLRTAVYQAYRTPTINELHRPFRVGNVVTRANDALDPESSLGVESALFARRGPAAMRVVAFWTRLTDAVVNVTLESGPDGIVRQRRNAGRIRAAGVEVEADARVTTVVTVRAAAAYIDSVFTEGAGLDGLRVPQVPHWQISAGVQSTWPRASLSFDWRVIGSQFDDDRNQFLLDSSAMLNARAGWRVRHTLELFAAVENALDQEQDVGRTPIRTIGLPRTARVGLRWSR